MWWKFTVHIKSELFLTKMHISQAQGTYSIHKYKYVQTVPTSNVTVSCLHLSTQSNVTQHNHPTLASCCTDCQCVPIPMPTPFFTDWRAAHCHLYTRSWTAIHGLLCYPYFAQTFWLGFAQTSGQHKSCSIICTVNVAISYPETIGIAIIWLLVTLHLPTFLIIVSAEAILWVEL